MAAIENFVRFIVGAILDKFKKQKDFRVMVLPDHNTPVSLRTHTAEPVPFAVFGKGIEPNNAGAYSETAAKATGVDFGHGHELMEYFMKS
jgi:2,3-bisphosphoglycerate-independent phosphoglycerate mutase